jgi:hypothetical protein
MRREKFGGAADFPRLAVHEHQTREISDCPFAATGFDQRGEGQRVNSLRMRESPLQTLNPYISDAVLTDLG